MDFGEMLLHHCLPLIAPGGARPVGTLSEEPPPFQPAHIHSWGGAYYAPGFVLIQRKPEVLGMQSHPKCSPVAVLWQKGSAHTLSFPPRHATGEMRACLTVLLFLRKMETKMKAENRAFVPQIQEWPSRPPGGATGKALPALPGRNGPKPCMVRTGPQPGLQPSRHLAILPLILHHVCTGLGAGTLFLPFWSPSSSSRNRQDHSG